MVVEKEKQMNFVGKGENAGNQHFSPFFHNVFYCITNRNYHLCYIYLSSAKAFNLEKVKFLSSGNGVMKVVITNGQTLSEIPNLCNKDLSKRPVQRRLHFFWLFKMDGTLGPVEVYISRKKRPGISKCSKIGSIFFQEDNVPVHESRQTVNWKEENDIPSMNCAPQLV